MIIDQRAHVFYDEALLLLNLSSHQDIEYVQYKLYGRYSILVLVLVVPVITHANHFNFS